MRIDLYTKTILTAMAQSSSDSTLTAKYLQPAAITKLDWLLMKAAVESFTRVRRWDEYHAIDSVVFYPAHPTRGLVGMTFAVNNESYVALSDDVARKVFADAGIGACSILT